MRCFTSALICCSARSSCVIASTVELMDSTPRRMGGRTKFSPGRMMTSSIFQDAKPGAVILTRYFPGGTARKENSPVTLDCVVREDLVSTFSKVMCALEMVASSVSVIVPERIEVLGASGSWTAGIGGGCWAGRLVTQGPSRREKAQRSLACLARLRCGLAHFIAAAACREKPNARKYAGEFGESHGNCL